MNRIKRLLVGPAGIRTPWRLAMFAALVVGATLVVDRAKIALIHALPRGVDSPLEPVRLIVRELGDFAALLVAGVVMARIEKRRIGDYGLALRRGFRTTFWEGALYGFAGVSLIVGVASLAGYVQLAPSELSIADAGLFLLAFLAVALMEEYGYRGYAMYTLTAGIGFWPATLVLAALFGVAHAGNSGETVLGIVNVVLYFVVFCYVLRRTGDLWLAVGFHMAWNWAEAYFYGLPDSGIVAPGHVFTASIAGPELWTGGTAGPEASLLDPLVLVAVALLVRRRYATSPETGSRSV